MYPFIRAGNICRFAPVSIQHARFGDVLLFVSNSGRLVVHRYYGTLSNNGNTKYVFKGDANLHTDDPVSATQVLGKLMTIRKRWRLIRADALLARLWGRWLLCYPGLTRWIRRSLSFKAQLRNKLLPRSPAHAINQLDYEVHGEKGAVD